jgi:hypothetical protein
MLVLFGVCRLKEVRLTFSQIKAWYRSVATFIVVGVVPTDTVGDVPRVVGVPAVVCITAVACIPAFVAFFLLLLAFLLWDYTTVGLIIFQLSDYP